jgi:hypothetical protein
MNNMITSRVRLSNSHSFYPVYIYKVDNLLDESPEGQGLYQFALNLQKEGKIKHIGFSTHGSAETILRMINSEKFSYVNIHKHYFGDYHAAGTPDTKGGEGNELAVKRALELDMGVFQVSLLYCVFAAVVVAERPTHHSDA